MSEVDKLRQENRMLRAQLAEMEALVMFSPVGVLVVNADTRAFASVNREAERILGMSPEPGSTLVRYHEVAIYRRADGKKYQSHERPLARALDQGEVVRAEEILIDLPDRMVATLVNATPIYSGDGRIVSAVAVLQDMTTVEERVRLREQLISMVSDELRTPLAELVARVAASLRSRELIGDVVPRQPYRVGDLVIDYAERIVRVAGRRMQLTATEYRVLVELSMSAGRVLTYDQILQGAWGQEYSGEAHLVRAIVRKLRQKLGDDAKEPKYIITEIGTGYRMADAEGKE